MWIVCKYLAQLEHCCTHHCLFLFCRFFCFVHTLFCIYCIWWPRWASSEPGALGTKRCPLPHRPHNHRNHSFRWVNNNSYRLKQAIFGKAYYACFPAWHTMFAKMCTLQQSLKKIWIYLYVQATAEQIRLAQMIYDKNDADFEDKVKQVSNIYDLLIYTLLDSAPVLTSPASMYLLAAHWGYREEPRWLHGCPPWLQWGC